MNPNDLENLINQITQDWHDGHYLCLDYERKKYKLSGAGRKNFNRGVYEALERRGLHLFRLPRNETDNPRKDKYLVISIPRVLGIYKRRWKGYVKPKEKELETEN